MKPTVTVVTPCYNAERFVGRTIESVLAQTRSDWELIVVDDGSTDGSAGVIEQYASKDPRVRLVRQPNGGVSRARSAGAASASPRSEYLHFLDADDLLVPSALERLVGYLNAHPEAGMVHCGYRLIDEHDRPIESDPFEAMRFVPGTVLPGRLPPAEVRTPFISIFCFPRIVPAVALLRRSVYEQTPGWDAELGQPTEDTDVFLHVACLSEVHFLPEVLALYRRHSQQSTSNDTRLRLQMQKLHRKWMTDPELSDAQRAAAREGWLFYEGRVRPFLRLLWAADHFRNHNYVEGLKACARSVLVVMQHAKARATSSASS